MKLLGWVVGMLGLACQGANAATIPPASEAPSLELGAFHASADCPLGRGWSVGAAGWWYPKAFQQGAVRANYCFYRAPHVRMSALASAGVAGLASDPFSLGVGGRWETHAWVQPALNLSLSLLPEPGEGFDLYLRASLGPVVDLTGTGLNVPGWGVPGLTPNLEVALRPWRGLELGVGYPEVAGLRIGL